MKAGSAVDLVARTIFGEARGEPVLDRLAVGLVIWERVQRPGCWGSDFASVVQKAGEFSCWNPDGVNRAKILRAEHFDPLSWTVCLNLAQYIVHHASDRDQRQVWGRLENFPTHYYRRELRPAWAKGAEAVPTGWDSRYVFVTGVKGEPQRRQQVHPNVQAI